MLDKKIDFVAWTDIKFWPQSLYPDLFPCKRGLQGNTPKHYGAKKIRFYWEKRYSQGQWGTT